jgi:hypothetical protein
MFRVSIIHDLEPQNITSIVFEGSLNYEDLMTLHFNAYSETQKDTFQLCTSNTAIPNIPTTGNYNFD